MNTKSLFQAYRRTMQLFTLFMLGVALSFNARAQLEKAPPQLMEKAPTMGTFYLLGRIPSVPYPFDPYHGTLPVYAYDGVFFVDDSQVSFMTQEFSFGEGGGGMMQMSSPSPPGIGGTNYGATNLVCSGLTNFMVSYRYSTNDLSLGIAQTTNTFIELTVHIATTNTSYDVFGTTNLTTNVTGLNRTNWVWLARISGGTTNFSWGLTNWCERYFQLGTMLDDDLDGLTTAYEILVSHTKWEAGDGWDSDGDGLSDDFELRNSLTDPNNPDTGNTGVPDGYKDPDGDGWTHIDEMRNGTTPLAFNTPAAPPNVAVHFIHQGTNATISWAPANGPVTGYIIRNGTNIVATVSSNVFELVDDDIDPETGNAVYAQFHLNNYTVQAVYGGGQSGTGTALDVWQPALAIDGAIVRGQGNQWYLLLAALKEEISSILLTWFDYQNFEIVTHHASIARSNFVNGVYAIPTNSLPLGQAFWGQGLNAAGELGPPIGLSGMNDDFIDLRQVLASNLRFFLRGATRTRPFNYAAYYDDFLDPLLSHPVFSEAYEYSGFRSFYEDAFEPEYSFTYSDAIRPLEENFYCRNFAYDPSLFTYHGIFLTGAHPHQSAYGSNRSISNALFAYEGTFTTDQVPSNQVGPIYYGTGLGVINTAQSEFLSEVGMAGYQAGSVYWTLSNSMVNFFGLPIDSVNLVRGNTPGQPAEYSQLTAGQSAVVSSSTVRVFPNVRQPTLQTVGYLFSVPVQHPETLSTRYQPPIPPEPDFSVTNITPLLMASVGQGYSHSGWAKKIITNGDTNKPAYLEQFFDQAFKTDANGNATTNKTGILSEFGEFFPTEPGRVILTTKPDIETSEVGQALVNVISLNVDANHDSTIDRTFAGPDTTSAQRPFWFWINNDHDTADGQDLKPPAAANSLDNRINGERDLEDFARLWVSGLPKLPSASGYTVTLSMVPSSGSPSINLFAAHDTNGSAAYLTDTNASAAQFTQEFLNGQLAFDYALRVGQVSPSQSYTVPVFTDGTPQFTRFLFEGAGAGGGQLLLTVSNGTTLVAQTAVWIELHDIREMYEQAYAENVVLRPPYLRGTNEPPSRHRVKKQISSAPDESKQVIVFVHGINNSEFDYESTSATFFKRLYWSGYRGRFASFRWPCLRLPNCGLDGLLQLGDLNNYNPGEYVAWLSARALGDYLVALDERADLQGYTLNLVAHSQGNIVASEALLQGAPFDNYILSQGAVPAHAYDPNAPTLQKLLIAETNSPTPFSAAQGGYHDYFAALNGNVVNLFNTNDFALATGTCLDRETNWEKNNESYKPEASEGNYSFDGTNCWWSAQQLFKQLTSSMEKKALVARSRSKAVGAQGGVANAVTSSVNLSAAPHNFDRTRPEHSAQFTRSIQSVGPYYQRVLEVIVP